MEPRKVDILHYIPDTTSKSKEFKELANTEDIEFNNLYELAWKWFLNTFVYNTDLDGVERWEEMLSIRPYTIYTLEQRQANILAKINQLIPYTYRRLEEILNSLCGIGTYEIILDHDKYRIAIKLFEGAREIGDINKMISPIIPANLATIQQLVREWLVEIRIGVINGWSGKIHVPLEQDGHWKYYGEVNVGLATLRQGERKIQTASPEIFKIYNYSGILTVRTNKKVIPCEKEVIDWT